MASSRSIMGCDATSNGTSSYYQGSGRPLYKRAIFAAVAVLACFISSADAIGAPPSPGCRNEGPAESLTVASTTSLVPASSIVCQRAGNLYKYVSAPCRQCEHEQSLHCLIPFFCSIYEGNFIVTIDLMQPVVEVDRRYIYELMHQL